MARISYATCSKDSDHLWELLNLATMWFIWKAQCIKVFEEREVPPVDSVVVIWNKLVSTLRGQYDEYDTIKVELGASIFATRGFQEEWSGSPFFTK